MVRQTKWTHIGYGSSCMNTGTAAQVLHCERAVDLAGETAVTFLTVVQRDSSGQTLRCESHLFWESSETHSHNLAFHFSHHETDTLVLREAVRQTHQLFAAERRRRQPTCAANLAYRTVVLPTLPIRAWRDAGKFRTALACLPDLTVATELQESLFVPAVASPERPIIDSRSSLGDRR